MALSAAEKTGAQFADLAGIIGDKSYQSKAGTVCELADGGTITVTEADHILTNNVGVCDDYSSAFMCMTRRIGLQSYTCACQAPNQSGGVSGHMVAFISVGGVNYIFDPQIEDYNAKGGEIWLYRSSTASWQSSS